MAPSSGSWQGSRKAGDLVSAGAGSTVCGVQGGLRRRGTEISKFSQAQGQGKRSRVDSRVEPSQRKRWQEPRRPETARCDELSEASRPLPRVCDARVGTYVAPHQDPSCAPELRSTDLCRLPLCRLGALQNLLWDPPLSSSAHFWGHSGLSSAVL